MAKKVTHGGKRKGAGRPPKKDGKAVTIAVTVPGDMLVTWIGSPRLRAGVDLRP